MNIIDHSVLLIFKVDVASVHKITVFITMSVLNNCHIVNLYLQRSDAYSSNFRIMLVYQELKHVHKLNAFNAHSHFQTKF